MEVNSKKILFIDFLKEKLFLFIISFFLFFGSLWLGIILSPMEKSGNALSFILSLIGSLICNGGFVFIFMVLKKSANMKNLDSKKLAYVIFAFLCLIGLIVTFVHYFIYLSNPNSILNKTGLFSLLWCIAIVLIDIIVVLVDFSKIKLFKKNRN